MAMHNTNTLLKYVALPIIIVIVMVLILSLLKHSPPPTIKEDLPHETTIKNTAAYDSAAESLDTLTAELSETKRKISEVSKYDESLKKQNSALQSKINTKHSEETSALAEEVQFLKEKLQTLVQGKSTTESSNGSLASQAITTVTDVSQAIKNSPFNLLKDGDSSALGDKNGVQPEEKGKTIPFYTIPANSTSVQDRLMTALVGRIAVKGMVTDPYPFKIVISDDNMAANGLRIPHLLQMIVSGYCEGDLNLVSVRGWVTSLTFIFDDGTISTTTSNDNDIGNFTKSNSLGYLSDEYGNPFIRGRLITNAPAYLSGNLALGAASGAANAYAQSQTMNTTSILGNTNTTVTGSSGKYIAGQALLNGTNEAQQWWHDREQQSFDAIYVPPINTQGQYITVAVNFAKEIHIDYNPKGRRLSHANDIDAITHPNLD